jgi:hypothetical protein
MGRDRNAILSTDGLMGNILHGGELVVWMWKKK